MNIAILIMTTAVLVGLFFVALGVSAVFSEQKKIRKEIDKIREVEVKVDFPAEMLMEIKEDTEETLDTLDELERLVHCATFLEVIAMSHKFKHGIITGQDAEELNPTYQTLIGMLEDIVKRKMKQEVDLSYQVLKMLMEQI